MTSQFLAPAVQSEDEDYDRSLRPRRLAEFVGQQRVREQLQISLDATRARGEALDHVLLVGPPGLGKTSLAFIVREELGVEQRPAELDERIAGDDVLLAGAVGRGRERGISELLLQLEHDPLRRLLPDAGNRLEPRRVAAHDRAAQVDDRRARDDRERDLRPDPAHGEQLHEELTLAPIGEAVELERVLAHVEVGLDGDLVGGITLALAATGGLIAYADLLRTEPDARTTPLYLLPAGFFTVLGDITLAIYGAWRVPDARRITFRVTPVGVVGRF